jgi:hypothetical protein
VSQFVIPAKSRAAGREPGSSKCLLALENSGFRISSRKAGFVRNDGFLRIVAQSQSGWLELLPKRQKHFSAFIDALAIPPQRDLYGKNQAMTMELLKGLPYGRTDLS